MVSGRVGSLPAARLVTGVLSAEFLKLERLRIHARHASREPGIHVIYAQKVKLVTYMMGMFAKYITTKLPASSITLAERPLRLSLASLVLGGFESQYRLPRTAGGLHVSQPSLRPEL